MIHSTVLNAQCIPDKDVWYRPWYPMSFCPFTCKAGRWRSPSPRSASPPRGPAQRFPSELAPSTQPTPLLGLLPRRTSLIGRPGWGRSWSAKRRLPTSAAERPGPQKPPAAQVGWLPSPVNISEWLCSTSLAVEDLPTSDIVESLGWQLAPSRIFRRLRPRESKVTSSFELQGPPTTTSSKSNRGTNVFLSCNIQCLLNRYTPPSILFCLLLWKMLDNFAKLTKYKIWFQKNSKITKFRGM